MIPAELLWSRKTMYKKRKEKIYYSWEDFSRDIKTITEKVRREAAERNLRFDGVFGVPRGGLVLAVCLSHSLDLPLLLAPTAQSLIIDDIADTGRTLQHYRDMGCFIVTPYYHPQSVVVPDIWLYRKPEDTGEAEFWIVFPWEEKK